MRIELRTPAVGFTCALLAVALATAATVVMRAWLLTTPFVLYFGAITAVAYYCGRAPGFASALLSVLAINYLFVPHVANGIIHPSDVVSMVCFCAATLFASFAADRQRNMLGALANIEGQLRQVVENMDEMFFSLDSEWNFIHVNHHFEQFNNFRREDVVGKCIWDLFPQAKGGIYERTYREVLETGREVTIENQNPTTGKWYRLRVVPNGAGVSVFVAEVTQFKAFEQKRLEVEQRFQLMADSAPVLIWIGGLRPESSWFNRRWLEFTGHTLEQDQQSGWLKCLHPDDMERCAQTYRRHLEAREPFVMDFRMRRADGEYRWLQGAGVPFYDAAGEFQGYVGSCVDVTERAELEQERAGLLDAERTARSQAERMSQLKDEFLATLSHELRTPLNAILGWAQLLSGDPTNSPQVDQALAVIERNARLQVRLVEDLLDMSRIVSGNMRLERSPILLEPVVQSALDSVRPMAESRGVEVELHSALQQGVLLADGSRLQQVVWNLLTNAIKFSPSGGLVRVHLEETENACRIVVSDEGHGISPEFLPYVFDRFRQQDGSITRRHGGLGLGLGLVRHLVELHGGEVSVTSAGEGEGATFCVSLPTNSRGTLSASNPPEHPGTNLESGALENRDSFCDSRARDNFARLEEGETGSHETVYSLKNGTGHPSPHSAIGSHHEESAGANNRLDGAKVLLVDDDGDSLNLVRRILELAGAETECAESARQAWQLLESKPFDFLVSDIGMPQEDGFALIQRVRTSSAPEISSIRALALTAMASARDKARAIEAGFDIHLTKPVCPEQLVRVMGELQGQEPASVKG